MKTPSEETNPENTTAVPPRDKEPDQPQTEAAKDEAGYREPEVVAQSTASNEQASYLQESKPDPQRDLDPTSEKIPTVFTSSAYDYPVYHQIPNGDLCVSSEAEPAHPDDGPGAPVRFKLGWKKRPQPGGWDAAKYPVHELIAGSVDAKLMEERQARHIDDQLAGRQSVPDGKRTRAEEECFRKGYSQRKAAGDPGIGLTTTTEDPLTDSTTKEVKGENNKVVDPKPGETASKKLGKKSQKLKGEKPE